MLRRFTASLAATALVLFNAGQTVASRVDYVEANAVKRFDPSQIQFYLQPYDGVSVACSHKLLPHVPWWEVHCGNRSFTADVWMQLGYHSELDQTKITLMYHVSEGVKSSGLPLVQFDAHFTNIVVKKLTDVRGLQTAIDVKNGGGSLTVEVTPRF